MPICLYAYMPIYLYTYIPIYLYTYIPIYLYAYMPICLYLLFIYISFYRFDRYLYIYAYAARPRPKLCNIVCTNRQSSFFPIMDAEPGLQAVLHLVTLCELADLLQDHGEDIQNGEGDAELLAHLEGDEVDEVDEVDLGIFMRMLGVWLVWWTGTFVCDVGDHNYDLAD